jgi:hypothetical protein
VKNVKLVFESEYEKHSFEELLESIYKNSDPTSKGMSLRGAELRGILSAA